MKADIYSLGIVLLFLMKNDEGMKQIQAMNDLNVNEIKINLILNDFEKKHEFSLKLINIVKSMLKFKENDRIDIEKLFNNVANGKLLEIQIENEKIENLIKDQKNIENDLQRIKQEIDEEKKENFQKIKNIENSMIKTKKALIAVRLIF